MVTFKSNPLSLSPAPSFVGRSECSPHGSLWCRAPFGRRFHPAWHDCCCILSLSSHPSIFFRWEGFWRWKGWTAEGVWSSFSLSLMRLREKKNNNNKKMGFSNQILSSYVMRMRPALTDNETKKWSCLLWKKSCEPRWRWRVLKYHRLDHAAQNK